MPSESLELKAPRGMGMNFLSANDAINEFCFPAFVADGSTCVVLMDDTRKELMRIETKSEQDAVEVSSHIRQMVMAAMQRYEQIVNT